MELQELKSIWNQYDKKIDKEIKMDFQSFKKISLEKTQSGLTHLKIGAVIELVFNFICFWPVVRYSQHHISELKFVWPAIMLAILIALGMAWNIYSLVFLSNFNYKAPIAATQKKLANFNYWNLYRQMQIMYVLIPLSWGGMLIVFCKAILQIDIYTHPWFLIMNVVASILIVPPLIWFMKKLPDKKMEEALAFLESIKKFEQED